MAITPMQVKEAAATRWGLAGTATPVLDRLAAYGNLLLHWNSRFSLTSIRDEADLIERHLMEGVFAAAHHPEGSTALDFGSGTGVPGIVIALCRPEIHVTLAESQRKKAAFLAEAVRQLRLNTTVHAGRAETLPLRSFDAVWMRAVDKSGAMLSHAAELMAATGALCLFTTANRPDLHILKNWKWEDHLVPGSDVRVLRIGRPAGCSTWNTRGI